MHMHYWYFCQLYHEYYCHHRKKKEGNFSRFNKGIQYYIKYTRYQNIIPRQTDQKSSGISGKKKAANCKSVISLNLALFLSELPLPPSLPQLSQNERHAGPMWLTHLDAAFTSLWNNRGFPPFRPYTLLIYHGSEHSALTHAGWHFLFAKENLQIFRNNSSWRPSRLLTGFQTCKIKRSIVTASALSDLSSADCTF